MPATKRRLTDPATISSALRRVTQIEDCDAFTAALVRTYLAGKLDPAERSFVETISDYRIDECGTYREEPLERWKFQAEYGALGATVALLTQKSPSGSLHWTKQALGKLDRAKARAKSKST